MEQDKYQLEQDIIKYAKSSQYFKECYLEDLKTYADEVFHDYDFDERLAKGGDEDLRDDINEALYYDLNLDELPDDYPLEKYKDYVNKDHANNYDFDDYISDNWDWISEEYYQMYDRIYKDNFIKIREYIYDYMKDYDNITYKLEDSHSWSKGRYPSYYFTFINENSGDEVTLRIFDGHNNGHSSDYGIIFDEYEESDLDDILKEIIFDLE